MDKAVSVDCPIMIVGCHVVRRLPTRVSKETPAASCSALPQTGDRIGSSLRLGKPPEQSANARRRRSWVNPPTSLSSYASSPQLPTCRRTSLCESSANSGREQMQQNEALIRSHRRRGRALVAAQPRPPL